MNNAAITTLGLLILEVADRTTSLAAELDRIRAQLAQLDQLGVNAFNQPRKESANGKL
jgi:hypothetical protein